ncbi:hypothetical protein TNCV_1424141 [Trichonephila clavipes]|nr:hypothetical protein TNCV_1424141 [Trichonephila clavipes]
MAEKDILELKNIMDPDSGDENEMDNAAPVSASSEMRNVMKIFQRNASPACRKGTIHLQASRSSPGFEARIYGITIRVSSHYTRWVIAQGL